jgi:hypothetical protein
MFLFAPLLEASSHLKVLTMIIFLIIMKLQHAGGFGKGDSGESV